LKLIVSQYEPAARVPDFEGLALVLNGDGIDGKPHSKEHQKLWTLIFPLVRSTEISAFPASSEFKESMKAKAERTTGSRFRAPTGDSNNALQHGAAARCIFQELER